MMHGKLPVLIVRNVYYILKKYDSDELVQWRMAEQAKPIAPVSTSSFLRQDGYIAFFRTPEVKNIPIYYISDDDRLYWWDGSVEVRISENTVKWLMDLAKQHKELMEVKGCEPAKDNFNKFFFETIVEINKYYERIYPFQTMFYEFLENGSKKEYIAAVILLKKLADSEEYRKFGDVIKYARRWDMTSRNVTHNYAKIRLKRYLSVMANRKLREKYFEF